MTGGAPYDPVEITAGGLHLRPLGPERLELLGDLVATSRDPETVRWTTVPDPYGEPDARQFLDACARGWSSGEEAVWAVLDAVTGGYLATVGVRGLQRGDGVADVGVVAAPRSRGRGIVPAATRVAAGWAFAGRGVARLEWYADPANTSSQRAALRAGFRYEGVLRSRVVGRDGSRSDGWLAALLPADLAGPPPDAALR